MPPTKDPHSPKLVEEKKFNCQHILESFQGLIEIKPSWKYMRLYKCGDCSDMFLREDSNFKPDLNQFHPEQKSKCCGAPLSHWPSGYICDKCGKDCDTVPTEKLPNKGEEKGCGICGGTLVFIRGKYPHTEQREVCPTCLAERLEQIQVISAPEYGVAYKAN